MVDEVVRGIEAEDYVKAEQLREKQRELQANIRSVITSHRYLIDVLY